jgi:putative endonuclease
MLKATKVLKKAFDYSKKVTQGKNTRIDGQFFEDKACIFLQKKGFILSARNVNFPTGEIDLIMFDGPQLVFVEVRFRHNNEFGGAAASIDNRKQTKLIKTAQLYLQQKFGNRPPSCRFDVIAIDGDKKYFNVNWIKNAI